MPATSTTEEAVIVVKFFNVIIVFLPVIFLGARIEACHVCGRDVLWNC
jgi:hypothetical protein